MEAPRNGLRDRLRERVRSTLGSGELDLARPPGDDGLFGPRSAAWAVHGDVTAMLIGGISALLLQMLHPAALAGVWDHSDARRDMAGRLRRTAGFVAQTTYGSTETARGAIARVRAVHDRVSGMLPDGTRYHANDPALLAWVHVAEADSFLRAHVRYRDPGFRRSDAYLAEMAELARALGAAGVPESRAGVAAFYAAVRPQLRSDARTRDMARLLLAQRSADAAMAPFEATLLQAGLDLLPPWAAAMHGLGVPRLRRPALRLGAAGIGQALRWAMA